MVEFSRSRCPGGKDPQSRFYRALVPTGSTTLPLRAVVWLIVALQGGRSCLVSRVYFLAALPLQSLHIMSNRVQARRKDQEYITNAEVTPPRLDRMLDPRVSC